VPQMIDFISKLIDDGYAYKAEGGSVYFSVSKFNEYGKLSGASLDKLKTGASGRVSLDEYDKDNAVDFALWKSYVAEDGDVFWETKLGKGRPGWHIECSVMANTLLGETIDIHTGGEDLLFPHHENEIAQSEAYNKKPFARFWLHSKHLVVDGNKMSKSLNNFYTLKDIENKGYNPLALKLLYFSSHYRNQMNFTFESLDNAQKNIIDINQTIAKLTNYYSKTENDDLENIKKTSDKYLKDFITALEDDLNSPKAIATFFEFVRFINSLISSNKITNSTAKKILSYFKKYESLLGLFDFPLIVSKAVVELGWKRFEFRLNKNFAESDKLRDLILEKGYKIDDLPNGFVIITR
jgi:cysteinyl-tRNA synthetase